MDDRTKAKALMAGGLSILAIIGLVVVLVVVPAIRSGSGSHEAVAQGGPPGAPPGAVSGPPGAPGGMSPGGPGGMPGGSGGMPGMPGALGGAPGAPGAAGGAAGAGPGAGPAAGAAAPVVEPLEKSRPDPFASYSGPSLLAAKPQAGLAFMPSYHTMPAGVYQQYQYPIRGGQGQSIKVPAPKALKLTNGPEAPPQEEWMRVAGVFYDQRGKAMVILQAGGPGQEGTVLQIGDRFHGWKVEQITRTTMVLSKDENGKPVRRVIHLTAGGGGAAGARPGGAAPGAPTAPGAGGRTAPGITVPGAGGAGGPRGRRGAGGAAPGGAFPGVQGGGAVAPGAGAVRQ